MITDRTETASADDHTEEKERWRDNLGTVNTVPEDTGALAGSEPKDLLVSFAGGAQSPVAFVQDW